jgi:hypothetical protein
VNIEISEDPSRRHDFARDVATSMLYSWRYHAVFLSLASCVAVVAETAARWNGHNPPLIDLVLLFAFVALAGVAISAVAYLTYRFLPPQRWIFRPDRISMRGREIGSVKYSRLEAFEVEPIEDPPGSIFFGVHCVNGREYTVIATASSATRAAEDELARRLTSG